MWLRSIRGKRSHFPGNAKEQVAGPSGINARTQQKGGGQMKQGNPKKVSKRCFICGNAPQTQLKFDSEQKTHSNEKKWCRHSSHPDVTHDWSKPFHLTENGKRYKPPLTKSTKEVE